MARLVSMIASVLVVCVVAVSDASTAEQPKAELSTILGGAYAARSFEDFEKPAYVNVVSYDDSPDVKRIIKQFEIELAARDLRNERSKSFALVIALESRVLSPEDSRTLTKPVVFGTLRADLATVPEGRVIWESEVVYEPRDGDILSGAIRVTPLVVETLGEERSMPKLGRF